MAKVNQIIKFLNDTSINAGIKLVMQSILAVVIFSFLAMEFISVPNLITIDLFLIIVFIALKWPRWGLYLMAFFYPFWGWQYVSGSINVPYVDLVALSLFVSLGIRTLIVWFGRLEGESVKKFVYLKEWPGWKYFSLFFIASLVAVWQGPDWLLGLKYLLRPILFLYLMFVVLPANIITNKKVLERVVKVMVGSGVLTILIGLISLFLGGNGFFLRRMQPIVLWGFNPLGGNHNAVAEVLLVTLPLALFLYFITKKIKDRGWYVLIILATTFMLLLTFSRAGWLALLLQLLLIYLVFYGHRINRQTGLIMFIVLMLILLMVYFVVWNQIQDLEGATSSRWLMTSVAWHHFLNHSVFGNGLNSFNELVGGTYVYQIEYGDPLDSHGFLQKLITESGLVGLVTFLSFLSYFFAKYFKAFIHAAKENKMMVLCFVVMLIGVVFFQLFSTSYFIVKMWLPIGVGLAAVRLFE